MCEYMFIFSMQLLKIHIATNIFSRGGLPSSMGEVTLQMGRSRCQGPALLLFA